MGHQSETKYSQFNTKWKFDQNQKQAQLRVPHSKLFYIEKDTIIDDDEKF